MGVPVENRICEICQLMTCGTDGNVMIWDTRPPKVPPSTREAVNVVISYFSGFNNKLRILDDTNRLGSNRCIQSRTNSRLFCKRDPRVTSGCNCMFCIGRKLRTASCTFLTFFCVILFSKFFFIAFAFLSQKKLRLNSSRVHVAWKSMLNDLLAPRSKASLMQRSV